MRKPVLSRSACTRLIMAILVGIFVIGMALLWGLYRSSFKSKEAASPRREQATVSTSTTPFQTFLQTEEETFLFEGSLFSDATTTIYLYRHGGYASADTIQGAYADGRIEGSMVLNHPQTIALNFISYPGIFAFAHATATVSEDGQTIRGELMVEEATTTRSFTLTRAIARTGSIPIRIHHLKASWESSPFVEVCDVEMEYPMTDDQDINALIVRAITGVQGQTIEGVASEVIQACKNLATDTPGHPHEISVRKGKRIMTAVKLNQDGLLSIFFEGQEWGGGAHHVRENRSVTIDLEKRRVVTLVDLIKPAHLQDFLTYEKQLTLETAYQDFTSTNPISREEFSQLADFEPLRSFVLSTRYLSGPEQRRRYGGLQDFYLTPEGLMKYYNSYDLGPWMNTPLTLIWYQDQPAFAQNGVLKKLFFTNGYLMNEKRVNGFTERLRGLLTGAATDTSRWLTYTSPKNRFSLRYPSSFVTEMDPRLLHQTQSSPDRPEGLHDFALYHPLPEAFPTSLLVQVTQRYEWEKIQPQGYLPLVTSTQWEAEKQFLTQAIPGDGCDFLILKYYEPASLWLGSHDCRVIRLGGMTVLDRQMAWSPSTMIGRVYTFYRGDRRFDITVPNGLYEYIDFDVLDRIKKGTIIEIGEKMVESMRFW